MHKMCSDESKCAPMKGCLCSDKKGHSEILLDKYRNFWVKRSFRNWSPAFAPEMCSDEFSLKHALNRPMYHRRPGFKGHDPQLLDWGWGRVVGLGGNNKFPERGGK